MPKEKLKILFFSNIKRRRTFSMVKDSFKKIWYNDADIFFWSHILTNINNVKQQFYLSTISYITKRVFLFLLLPYLYFKDSFIYKPWSMTQKHNIVKCKVIPYALNSSLQLFKIQEKVEWDSLSTVLYLRRNKKLLFVTFFQPSSNAVLYTYVIRYTLYKYFIKGLLNIYHKLNVNVKNIYIYQSYLRHKKISKKVLRSILMSLIKKKSCQINVFFRYTKAHGKNIRLPKLRRR